MERLVLTLPCEHGELFYVMDGRRVLLANCTPIIEIYEHTAYMKALGGCGTKHYHAALVLCGEPEFTRTTDEDFIKRIDRFDLSVDIQRKDGVFELIRFTDIQPHDINLDGEWIFELNENQATIRKLLTL